VPDGSPIEVKTFYKGEKVRFYTKLRFDATRGSAGTHRLVYKWYTGDVVSQSFDAQKQFDVSPMDWWAYIDVSHLSPGHHLAELHSAQRLLIPPVLSEDDAFRRWFGSLPVLAEVEDDDEDVEYGPAG
jgi:hypothetical protein